MTPCMECEGPLGANYYEFDEGAICDDCLEEFLTDSSARQTGLLRSYGSTYTRIFGNAGWNYERYCKSDGGGQCGG